MKEADNFGGGGDFVDLTFAKKNSDEVIFPKKDNPIEFYVLPAMPNDGESYDKENYLPYRDEEDYFSEWMWVFVQWRFVGTTHNILSPKFFGGPEETDPVQMLWDTAWNDERYWEMIGKNPSTKKVDRGEGDEWRSRILRRPETRIGMNVLVPAKRDLENKFLVVGRQSMFPFDYAEFPNKAPSRSNSGWGLADALDTVVKGHENADPDDYDGRFLLGDITDPRALAPCEVKLTRPPQGGLPVYNATVIDHEDGDRIRASAKHLRGRFTPEEIFIRVSEMDAAEAAAEALSPHGEDAVALVEQAWAGLGVGYDSIIERVTASRRRSKSGPTRGSVAKDDDGELPAPSRKASGSRTTKPDPGSEPPFSEKEEDDLPPPAKAKRSRPRKASVEPDDESPEDLEPVRRGVPDRPPKEDVHDTGETEFLPADEDLAPKSAKHDKTKARKRISEMLGEED